MLNTLDIRWSAPDDRDAVLAFIATMGFTPRDAITWDGLAMRAICAWRSDHLIGVLPIEPRPLRISPDVTVLAAHLTCVAVDPDERGSGVGSAMQRLLATDPPSGARLLTVYREEPESPGYQWYAKNGFTRALHLVSWTRSAHADTGRNACATVNRIMNDEARRLLRQRAKAIGVVDQSQRPLDAWLAAHPYRSRYAFDMIDVEDAYAVIGVGALHSAADRLDILDLIASDAAAARRALLVCVDRARSTGIGTIRVALAERDPLASVAADLGFTPGWNFDLLVKPLDRTLQLDANDWRYASIDFA